MAVARALVGRPEIIFADEPTGNLDSRAGAEILAFMRQAVDDLGQTIVMVTHDPVAAAYADRVLFLADGRIVDEMADPTADAGPRPHEAVRGLIRAPRRPRWHPLERRPLPGHPHRHRRRHGVPGRRLDRHRLIRASLGGDAADQYPTVAAAVQPDTSTDGLDPRVSPALLASIEAVPGVDAAAGVLDGPLSVFDPQTGRPLEEGAIGSMWVPVDQLNPLAVVEGRAPAATGEIALDRRSAERLDDARVGTSLDIATTTGLQQATVVGLTEFGSRASENPDGTISVAEPWSFTVLGDGTPGYSEVLVAGPVDGPEQEELVAALGAVVPPGFVVVDRSDFLSQTEGLAAGIADFARPVLIGFSLLALFVCAFVIYNTFSVVVAQRTRELALLRAVAATPRQVPRSVRLEGLVIGFVGSTIGVLVGAALTLAMPLLLGLFGLSVGNIGITITATTVLSCLFVGTAITVLSVLAPARRAARTPPIEALRSGASTTARSTAARTVVSLLLLGSGAALLVLGGTAGPPVFLGVGAFAFVLGILAGGPILATWFARGARAATSGAGLTGRLASDNLVRNPRRTATTANALVIGVLLVTFVSIAGATIRDWSVEQINQLSDSDLTVSSNVGGIDPTLVTTIQDLPGVTATASVASSPASIDGSATSVATGNPADLVSPAGIGIAEGSLDDLASGGLAIGSLAAATDGGSPPGVGSTVTVVAPGGHPATSPSWPSSSSRSRH